MGTRLPILLLLTLGVSCGSFADALPPTHGQVEGMVVKFENELKTAVDSTPPTLGGDSGSEPDLANGTSGKTTVCGGAGSGDNCDADGWTTYGKLYGPCNACGFSHDAIVGILAREHDCSKEVFWKDSWVDRKNLSGQAKDDVLECVLLCAEKIPCRRPPCLLDMHVRPGTTDSFVLAQIFFERNFFEVPKNLTAPRSILDAGANIGAASVYFALMFPNSSVVSVEASEGTYGVLRANARRFPNISPVLAAVWSKTSALCLVNDRRTRNEWGNRVLPCDTIDSTRKVLSTMQGLPIPLLSKIFGIPSFDWLKIDIEGAEVEVFAEGADVDFLKTGQVMFCEIHDMFYPNATEIVTKTMATVPRWKDWGQHNELRIWLAL